MQGCNSGSPPPEAGGDRGLGAVCCCLQPCPAAERGGCERSERIGG